MGLKDMLHTAANTTLFVAKLKTQHQTSHAKRVGRKGRLDTLRYALFDWDGAEELDTEELFAMMPPRIRERCGAAAFRGWFKAADLDGDGKLSMNALFLWALQSDEAVRMHGAMSLEAAFGKYDTKWVYDTKSATWSRDGCGALGPPQPWPRRQHTHRSLPLHSTPLESSPTVTQPPPSHD